MLDTATQRIPRWHAAAFCLVPQRSHFCGLIRPDSSACPARVFPTALPPTRGVCGDAEGVPEVRSVAPRAVDPPCPRPSAASWHGGSLSDGTACEHLPSLLVSHAGFRTGSGETGFSQQGNESPTFCHMLFRCAHVEEHVRGDVRRWNHLSGSLIEGASRSPTQKQAGISIPVYVTEQHSCREEHP